MIRTGALPPGLSINDQGVISGVSADTGTFSFWAKVQDIPNDAVDSAQFSIRMAPYVLIPGDLDHNGTVDIADLTVMVSLLFENGPFPTYVNSADVDASCSIDISDLTYFLDFLFSEGPAPLTGCVQ